MSVIKLLLLAGVKIEITVTNGYEDNADDMYPDPPNTFWYGYSLYGNYGSGYGSISPTTLRGNTIEDLFWVGDMMYMKIQNDHRYDPLFSDMRLDGAGPFTNAAAGKTYNASTNLTTWEWYTTTNHFSDTTTIASFI